MSAAVLDAAEFGDVEFAADGPKLCSDEQADEELLASSEGSSDPFDAVLGELEVLMMDEALNARIDDFTRRNCEVFSDSDENKLEYTALFTEYTSMVEKYIEERLGASVAEFDMVSFCTTLSERAKSDEALLDHPALEMLTAYSDFEAFKALMVSARAGQAIEAEGGLLCVSGGRLDLDCGGGAGVAMEEEGGAADSLVQPNLDDALSISAVKK